MTVCLKGHRCGGRRRREESLISPHLRFTIPDLRRPTHYRVHRKSSIVHPCAVALSCKVHILALNPLYWSQLRLNPHTGLKARTSKILKICHSQLTHHQSLKIIGKVKQGKARVKNSEFFYGHFYGKSLENQGKTTKKTPQNTAKNMRFLTCFITRVFGPVRRIPVAFHPSLTAVLRVANVNVSR